jgi:hypothetical protein
MHDAEMRDPARKTGFWQQMALEKRWEGTHL